MTLKIIGSQWPPIGCLQGSMTFQQDMLSKVIPELRKSIDLTIDYNGRLYSADILYALCGLPLLEDITKTTQKIFAHIHSNYPEFWKQKRLDHYKSIMLEKGISFYHTHQLDDFVKTISNQSIFFPMAIDTGILPNPKERNGKWIFYGNIFSDTIREQIVQDLRKNIDFDILSCGTLNGTILTQDASDFVQRTTYTRRDCLNLVSQYSCGIGAGRSALEMLAMGLKVLVVGRKYGGPISDLSDFYKHRDYNCNGTINTGTTIVEDIAKLQESTFIMDPQIIDIGQYVPRLLKLFALD